MLLQSHFLRFYGNIFLCLLTTSIWAQNLTNIRGRTLNVEQDTVFLDTLSIVPNSEIIYFDNYTLTEDDYELDYARAKLLLKHSRFLNQELNLTYRVFPLLLGKTYEHKRINQIKSGRKEGKDPFLFEYRTSTEDVFYLNGLTKQGSISRGIQLGNNQDLSVNSNLNLQLSGKISDAIMVSASISDDNIPIQANGNTQQLQDFDRVYIQLSEPRWKLIAGDFYMQQNNSHFMKFNKKVQGGSFTMDWYSDELGKTGAKITPSISAAASRGKFSRNTILGIEGNQGPYRLTGNDNERFIILLSGTERVYVDGKLMKRGTAYDYVIDYNTAELVFTTNKLITKDSRIVVEFQYSDRNYARSLIQGGADYKSNKLALHFNVFSESDAKNQPLLQELDDDQKRVLSLVGDSLDQAVVSNVSAVSFSENIVLYQLTDSLGYDSVFVYSTNPENAQYQLGFSFFGENRGNYSLIQNGANGKVYEWLAPVNGVMQGSYEPVILLVTPKATRMANLSGRYELSEGSILSWEGAVSDRDLNLFSNVHDGDNLGYAFKVDVLHQKKLAEKGKEASFGAGYEYVSKNFRTLERFRTVEFQRDWNILSNFGSDQHMINVMGRFDVDQKLNLMYQANVLNSTNEYTGLKNLFSGRYRLKKMLVKAKGSYLISEGTSNTSFLRHIALVQRQFGKLTFGVEEELEQNKFTGFASDSLTSNSFKFFIWKAFVQSSDTSKYNVRLSYQQRLDELPSNGNLTRVSNADDVNFSFSGISIRKHHLQGNVIYRKLAVVNQDLLTTRPDENILTRINYNSKLMKDVISLNTFYEIGTGLEVKREFSFIEVQPGQGTHTYIGDVNGNNAYDLGEFEVAVFQDQANFIKIFTPTADFVRTYSNQLNQGVFIKPEAIWGKHKGIRKWVSRLSNRTNYRVSRKVSDKKDYYNPFAGDIDDETLVTLNYGILSTLYFNRNSNRYSIDFTWQDTRDKSLLVNGIESRSLLNRVVKARFNLTRVFTFNLTILNGEKGNRAEFFNNRNYDITISEVSPRISYQPNTKLKTTFLMGYKEKNNAAEYGGERSFSQEAGIELRYNTASKGSIKANFNYVLIDFLSADNASLTYEMLEGLQDGTNITWQLAFQRNIAKNMQFSLNYNGRRSNSNSSIHAGGMQVRAFF